MAEGRWAGLAKSRTQKRIDNNLGIIPGARVGKNKKYRDDRLHKLDKYYDGTQYDHLPPWDQDPKSEYIPIRQRQPRINYRFGKRLANEVASMMFGTKRFPKLHVEDDPDMTMYLSLVQKASHLQARMVEATRFLAVSGSVFVRFFFVEGQVKLEVYRAKYCYPVMDEVGELEYVDIIYTYKDENDRDEVGNPIEKWAKVTLGKEADILYDNPKVESSTEPTFEEIGRAAHGLGFVQGEWFRTSEKPNTLDGDSLLEDILDFIDELNYNWSQSSQAISYNQEPQLTFKGMDVDEIDSLTKSSQKGWDLGRDGDASFLESNLGAVERATDFRDRARLAMQDVSRVILMDPEKFAGQAQSGKALETLLAPLVNLIEEMRPALENRLVSLLTKIAMVNLILINAGADTAVQVPPGWEPKSWNIAAEWPPVFPQTLQDLKEKLAVAAQASNASLISRETLTRWLARDFAIEDVEAEIAKIAAQPVINPFGAF